jgi:hypothetical protein
MRTESGVALHPEPETFSRVQSAFPPSPRRVIVQRQAALWLALQACGGGCIPEPVLRVLDAGLSASDVPRADLPSDQQLLDDATVSPMSDAVREDLGVTDACASIDDPAACGSACRRCPSVEGGVAVCQSGVCGIACAAGRVEPALASILALIDSGDRGLDQARECAERWPAACAMPLSGARLLSPLPEPRQMRDCLVFEQHLLNAMKTWELRTGRPSAPISPVWNERPTWY